MNINEVTLNETRGNDFDLKLWLGVIGKENENFKNPETNILGQSMQARGPISIRRTIHESFQSRLFQDIDLEIIALLKQRKQRKKTHKEVLAVTYIPLSALATENGRNWKVISTPKEVPKCNLLKANGKDGFPLFKVNKDDKADQFRPWIGGDKDNTDRILGHADRILGYISLSIEHLEQYVSDGNKANPNTKTNLTWG